MELIEGQRALDEGDLDAALAAFHQCIDFYPTAEACSAIASVFYRRVPGDPHVQKELAAAQAALQQVEAR